MEEWCKDCGYDHDAEGDIVNIVCDCGRQIKAVVIGGHGQLLRWHCLDCGERQDVNA
jgi:hypothetical protein